MTVLIDEYALLQVFLRAENAYISTESIDSIFVRHFDSVLYKC